MHYIKTFLLLFGLMALFLWVGSFFGRQGMLLALILGGVFNFVAYWFSDKIVLKMNGAQEATESEAPQLYRAVRELSLSQNLPMPRVYLIPMPAPNAFATGRNPAHAAVAVSPSLLQMLNHDELKAVLAHELSHIKNRDVLTATVAACVAGAITYLAHMAQWAALFGGYGSSRDNERGGNAIGWLLMIIVAPLAALLIQLAIGRSREYAADASGAGMTHQPLALASALEKIHEMTLRRPVAVEPATVSLYIANPLGKKSFLNMFSTHPPIEQRIKRLQEMAYRT